MSTIKELIERTPYAEVADAFVAFLDNAEITTVARIDEAPGKLGVPRFMGVSVHELVMAIRNEALKDGGDDVPKLQEAPGASALGPLPQGVATEQPAIEVDEHGNVIINRSGQVETQTLEDAEITTPIGSTRKKGGTN